MSTFYDILCISPNASDQEIRKAYRLQVMLYHPDKNPSPEATARFFLISQAYETLIDKNKRFLYDHNLGEYSGGQYYMPSYEEWMEQRRKKQAEEEEEERIIFERAKKQFQDKPYYTYRKIRIYCMSIAGYLCSVALFSVSVYLVYLTHWIFSFVLLPFLSGALILAYYAYAWFQDKKRLF
jgi:hypothetical protein